MTQTRKKIQRRPLGLKVFFYYINKKKKTRTVSQREIIQEKCSPSLEVSSDHSCPNPQVSLLSDAKWTADFEIILASVVTQVVVHSTGVSDLALVRGLARFLRETPPVCAQTVRTSPSALRLWIADLIVCTKLVFTATYLAFLILQEQIVGEHQI